MKMQKYITYMGDRIYISFFVNEEGLYTQGTEAFWFEDIYGKIIEIGDNSEYLFNSANKESIKEDLKSHFDNKEKGLYKEFKQLLNKMKEYEYQNPF